jgi:hypothetical protein
MIIVVVMVMVMVLMDSCTCSINISTIVIMTFVSDVIGMIDEMDGIDMLNSESVFLMLLLFSLSLLDEKGLSLESNSTNDK